MIKLLIRFKSSLGYNFKSSAAIYVTFGVENDVPTLSLPVLLPP